MGENHQRWGTGVWLGVERHTGQYVLHGRSRSGIKHARTIKPMPHGQQWSKDRIAEVSVTPWSSHEAPPPHIEPQQPKEPDAVGRKLVVRRIYIRQSDIDNHGFTEHCPRCDHIREGRPGKPPNHSEACRDRLTKAIAATPEGAKRLKDSEE